jgi:predicted membrane protein
MVTGFAFVLFGILVLIYPQLLAILFASFLILFGLGMMVTSWQFRRLRKHSQSRFINWIIRW